VENGLSDHRSLDGPKRACLPEHFLASGQVAIRNVVESSPLRSIDPLYPASALDVNAVVRNSFVGFPGETFSTKCNPRTSQTPPRRGGALRYRQLGRTGLKFRKFRSARPRSACRMGLPGMGRRFLRTRRKRRSCCTLLSTSALTSLRLLAPTARVKLSLAARCPARADYQLGSSESVYAANRCDRRDVIHSASTEVIRS
jgi:hypothetical protein